mgnify:FL=1
MENITMEVNPANQPDKFTFEMFGSFNLENFSVLEEDAPVEKKREALTLDAEDFTELCEQQFTGVSIDYEPVDYANYYIATNC